MTTAVILQPHYLPYSGFFKLVQESDVFVFLDNVQFEKQSWQDRNRIKVHNGIQWLRVPTIRSFGQPIKDVRINNDLNWQAQHWKAITNSYSRANHFQKYHSFFEREVYSRTWEKLADLNIFIITELTKQLGLKTKFVRASELGVEGKRTELVVNILKKIGADRYYSNLGSKEYMDQERHFFKDLGVKIEFMDYQHPTYPQLFGNFIPYLSVIDLLFNQGENSTKTILGENHGTISN